MFKTKLIENESYYKLRRKQLILFILISFILGLIANFNLFSSWVIILMTGIYIIGTLFMAKNQKLINLILGNQLIEIDEKEIRIKSKKGKLIEGISLIEIDKIILKDIYKIQVENINVQVERNHLILLKNEKERQLNFEIDTHYKVIQLNKVIESWAKEGYVIERIKVG